MNGKVLRELRKSKKLTLRQLAGICGLSHSFISDLEHDRYKPSIDSIKALANALDCSTCVLFDTN